MDAAKIRLSPAEIGLVMDAGLILTKNAVLDKIKTMLGALVSKQQELLDEDLENLVPAEVRATGSKISRGENYRGLPWVVLDHPRLFSKKDVMAVRTLFWWGRCFSVTLHLSGQYKTRYEQKIAGRYKQLSAPAQPAKGLLGPDYYVCVNEAEWEHHFDADNYQPVQSVSETAFQTQIRERSFIKLARKIPLEQWAQPYEIREVLAWHYFKLLEVLA